MSRKETIIVPKLKKTVRLSDFVVDKFEMIPSRKGMKKAISKGYVFVNGKRAKTGFYLQGEEEIQLKLPVPKVDKTQSTLHIKLVHEDEDLAVVYKPPGLVTSGNMKKTVSNALPNIIKASSKVDRLIKATPVHRLDFATSGLLLVAKTRSASEFLSKQFENREVSKTYLAVITGNLAENEKTINAEIKGKEAITSYAMIYNIASKSHQNIYLLKVDPSTGRRHQIRVHLSEMGHPIMGDHKYGEAGQVVKGKGLFLHAYTIGFTHPESKEKMEFTIEPPTKFNKLFPLFDFTSLEAIEEKD